MDARFKNRFPCNQSLKESGFDETGSSAVNRFVKDTRILPYEADFLVRFSSGRMACGFALPDSDSGFVLLNA